MAEMWEQAIQTSLNLRVRHENRHDKRLLIFDNV